MMMTMLISYIKHSSNSCTGYSTRYNQLVNPRSDQLSVIEDSCKWSCNGKQKSQVLTVVRIKTF